MTMNVHFVGSVGLDTAEEVFAAVGDAVHSHLKRCPDGEIGGRRSWISWQWPLLRAMAFLELDEPRQTPGVGLSPLKLKSGVHAEDIHFGELGYAREAYTSYQRSCGRARAGRYRHRCVFRCVCRLRSR